MRVFAALETPYEIAEEIDAWWQEAATHLEAGDWRDVPMKNWHLTLAFYGDVQGGEVDDLAEALGEYVRGTTKPKPGRFALPREGEEPGIRGPIRLKTTRFGAFPKMSKPRVFWAGVDDADDSGKLKKMARCCRRAGHATVRKSSAKETPFRGHITLARAREFAAPIDADILADLEPLPELTWVADSLVLYQSILKPEGAQYRKLESFTFEGNRHVR